MTSLKNTGFMGIHSKKSIPIDFYKSAQIFLWNSWIIRGIQGIFGGENDSQGTIECTPNSVPMVFSVFSRDSWGL